jgi:hypothetical protein
VKQNEGSVQYIALVWKGQKGKKRGGVPCSGSSRSLSGPFEPAPGESHNEIQGSFRQCGVVKCKGAE